MVDIATINGIRAILSSLARATLLRAETIVAMDCRHTRGSSTVGSGVNFGAPPVQVISTIALHDSADAGFHQCRMRFDPQVDHSRRQGLYVLHPHLSRCPGSPKVSCPGVLATASASSTCRGAWTASSQLDPSLSYLCHRGASAAVDSRALA